MKKYISIFLMRLKMETQYRGAALGGILCQMFFGLVYIALYRAFYAGKPQDFPIGSLVTYVWLQQAFFRMLLAFDSELGEKIRTGGIAYDLCRPMNFYAYYYARSAAQKLMGSLLRAVPMLLFAMVIPCTDQPNSGEMTSQFCMRTFLHSRRALMPWSRLSLISIPSEYHSAARQFSVISQRSMSTSSSCQKG